MKKTSILKWVTVGVLSLSAVFFFLPYRFGVSPFEGILGFIGVSQNSAIYSLYGTSTINTQIVVLFIAIFGLPLILTLCASLMMSRKFGIGKCIAAAIFCAIAFFVYLTYFDSAYLSGSIGLVGNMICVGIGFVLVITNIIFYRTTRKSVNTLH